MSNNKQQTAVEYLVEQLFPKALSAEQYYHIEQAKEMDKERIETAYNKGTVHGIDYPESTLPLTGEQYYNETFGGNNEQQ